MGRAIDNQVLRNTGSHGSPTWSPVLTISECKLVDSKNTQDITTRAELGLEVVGNTTTKVSYTGKIRVPKIGNADANFNALRSAYYADTPVELAIIDGPLATDGCHGIWGYFLVTKWEQSEGNGDINYREFEFMPTISPTAGEPAARRVITASGALTAAAWNSSTYA